MTKNSAGIALYRSTSSGLEILLVHPGGPFWANKDEHAWSIPKGEYDPETESAIDAARREFAEELGSSAPDGEAIPLPPFRAGKKQIRAFLIHGDLDVSNVVSNDVQLEWPPRSGNVQSFPEVDRAAWFDLDTATSKLHKGQIQICDLILASVSTR